MRRNKEPLEPVVLVVCFCVAATQSAWGAVVPVLPLLAHDLGANSAELGLAITIFGVGRLVMNFPAGALSERVDPRKLLVAGMAVVVLSQFLTAFVPGLLALLVLRFFAGLGGGLAITSGMTLVAVLSAEHRRGYTMSVLQAVQLGAGALGPAVGGLLAAVWGSRAPFLACGIFAAAAVVAGWSRLFAVPRAHVIVDVENRSPTSRATGTNPLRERSFLAVCAVGFAMFLYRFAGQQSIIPLIGYTVVGISVGAMGVLFGLITLFNLFLITSIGALSDRVGRKRAIVPGMVVAALTTPVYVFTTQVTWFVAATVVAGIAVAVSGQVPGAYVADVAPPESRGRAIGIYRTWGDLACVIGPVALGAAMDRFGRGVPVITLGLTMLLIALIFGLVARETVGEAPAPSILEPPGA